MTIDWFTVIAQVVNFIVLVWLMKRFLYAPVLKAIDAREKRIADEIAAADTTQREARAEHALFEEKNRGFDAERVERMRAVQEEVVEKRRHLINKAHVDAEALQTQSLALLTKKATSLAETINHRVHHEAFALAQHTLREVASTSLEAQIVDVFASKLRGLDSDARQTLSAALETNDGIAVVRSAFVLPSAQQQIVEAILDEVLSTTTKTTTVQWHTDDTIVGGIELVIGGQTVSWTLAAHLDALHTAMAVAWSTSATTTAPQKTPATATTTATATTAAAT